MTKIEYSDYNELVSRSWISRSESCKLLKELSCAPGQAKL